VGLQLRGGEGLPPRPAGVIVRCSEEVAVSIHDETDAERVAVEARLEDRLRQMQAVTDLVAGWPVTGLKADKSFFDAESGD
jgi:hypothetical protein